MTDNIGPQNKSQNTEIPKTKDRPKVQTANRHNALEQERENLDVIKPSGAFVIASWAALMLGALGYLIGLWRSELQLNEKGYYFTVLVFGLFAVVTLQKSVRDRSEGIPVTSFYYGISWLASILSVLLLAIGLWNANELLPSERGFYAFGFILAAFGAVVVQKNTRDML